MHKSSSAEIKSLSRAVVAEKRSFGNALRLLVQKVFRSTPSSKIASPGPVKSATDGIKGMGPNFRPFPSRGNGVVTNEQVNRLYNELGV